jgi:hypothetical protein
MIEVDFELWEMDREGRFLRDLSSSFAGGAVEYVRDRIPNMACTIQFQGVEILEPFASWFAPFINFRIDGGDWTRQQLGMYTFDEPDSQLFDGGTFSGTLQGKDQLWLLALASTRAPFTVKRNQPYTDAFIRLLATVGIFFYEEPVRSVDAAATITYPIGTGREVIARAITDATAYTVPHTLLSGRVNIMPAAAPSAIGPTMTITPNDVLAHPKRVQATAPVPNVVIVSQDNPRLGIIYVVRVNADPESATSTVNRGGVEISEEYQSNFYSTGEATILADILIDDFKGRGDTYQLLLPPTVFFDVPSTVLLDYVVGDVNLNGLYSVLSWSMSLDENAAMLVTVGRVGAIEE